MTINVTSQDAVMIRRAAVACRAMQNQASGNVRWFDWVPKHLDRLADRLEYPDVKKGAS